MFNQSNASNYHDVLITEAALQCNSGARSVKEFNTQPLYLSVHRHDDYLPPPEFHSCKLHFVDLSVVKLTISRDSSL
jgi:hypothetical protein